MAKYQQRGQGTLASIMGLVMFFLVVDLIITALIVFNVNIKDLFKSTPNTDNVPTVTTVVTDNTGITDNN